MLKKKIHQYKTHFYKGSFLARYNLEFLVYYKFHDNRVNTIDREKQLKTENRKSKEALSNSINLELKDLYDKLTYE